MLGYVYIATEFAYRLWHRIQNTACSKNANGLSVFSRCFHSWQSTHKMSTMHTVQQHNTTTVTVQIVNVPLWPHSNGSSANKFTIDPNCHLCDAQEVEENGKE